MSNQSPASRVMLAALVTIIIVLIVVVAASPLTRSHEDSYTYRGKSHSRARSVSGPESPPVVAKDEAVVGSQRESREAGAEPAIKESAVADDDFSRTKNDHVAEQAPLDDDDVLGEQAGKLKRLVSPEHNAADRSRAKNQKMSDAAEVSPTRKVGKDIESPGSQVQDEVRYDMVAVLAGDTGEGRTDTEDSRAMPSPPTGQLVPPSVSMTEHHRKNCLVFVGDTIPDGTLPDTTGQEHEVLQSLGQRLTGIVFWNAANPYALDQFEELRNDLLPFKELGVVTIAVHVGPEPDNYAALCHRFGQGALCLTDPENAYFATVATGSVPRIYLVDANGKIIWLDIEYSRTTRYDLRNAIYYSLQRGDARRQHSAR